MPLVSVVIPTYNCGAYIGDAIESVLSQTYREVELIVVDDGSTDDTVESLGRYTDDIQIIRQENSGVSSARNAGIAAAHGQYVAFLDSDDHWHRSKLETQVRLLEGQATAQMAFSNFDIGDAEGGVTGRKQLEHHYGLFRRRGVTMLELCTVGAIHASGQVEKLERDALEKSDHCCLINAFPWLFLGNFINTSSVVIHRALLQEVGGFDTARRTQEDYELWLRLALRTQMAYSDDSLVLTRRRPGQLTGSDHNLEIASDVVEVLEAFREPAETRLGPREVRQRMATVRRQLALAELGASNTRGARRTLRRTLESNPFDPSAWAVWLWSFIPHSIGQRVRAAARRRGHR